MKIRSGIIRYTIPLWIVTLFLGCTKEMNYNLLNGNFQGHLYCYQDTTNLPGTVKIDGDNLSKTVTSDSSGKYTITGLSTGTYNLTFSKEGYGTHYIYGLPFIGGDSITEFVPSVHLAKLSNATVKNLKIEKVILESYYSRMSKMIHWSADFYPDKNIETNYIAYLGVDDKVSYKNYLSYHFIQYYPSLIELSEYDTLIFKKNTKIYMIVYPFIELGSDYPDLATGCIVYNGFQQRGSSNVASIVVE